MFKGQGNANRILEEGLIKGLTFGVALVSDVGSEEEPIEISNIEKGTIKRAINKEKLVNRDFDWYTLTTKEWYLLKEDYKNITKILQS